MDKVERAPVSVPVHEQVAELIERVDVLKGEVDGVQIALMKEHTPWYRNMSTIISIVALLLSFVTAWTSERRLEVQDVQSSRTELRSLLLRLAALPRENEDARVKYRDEPATMALVGGYLQQENVLLTRQAAELIDRLPADRVSATEISAVAMALKVANEEFEALKMFEQAIDRAAASGDSIGEVAALRGYADTLFGVGRADEGRVSYQRALSIFSKADHREYGEFVRAMTTIMTELSWAWSESRIDAVDEQRKHIESAEQILSGLRPGPGVHELQRMVAAARADLVPGAGGAAGPGGVSAAGGVGQTVSR
jgi:tetratricopeptide (TPR) repeat protein